MASIFEQTIVPKLDFSNFDESETNLLTCNFGQLIPCYVKEVLPNDVFTLGASAVVNFAPMVAPMYQDVNVSIHFFYCPDRILFDNFEQFITGAEEGYPLPENEIPTQPGLSISEWTELLNDHSSYSSWQGTLLDYIGLPSNLQGLSQASGASDWYDNTIISDMVLRAYFKIWFDYYRDENLQVEFADSENNQVRYFKAWQQWRAVSDPFEEIATGDAEDFMLLNNNFLPRYRAYRKDYFTACLPSPQKGEPVTLGISGIAPVTWNSEADHYISPNLQISSLGNEVSLPGFVETTNLGTFRVNNHDVENPQVEDLNSLIGDLYADSIQAKDSNGNSLPIGYADLSKATAVTVEQLREAFAVQEILESLSMRGSRYTEFLKGNFGVSPDDYKLQRPQFLGGLVTPVQVQQVLQQSGFSGEDSRDMTGYAAGRAFAGVGGRIFKQRFKEHGYILGIMSIMPKAYYYQGIPRHFLRKDRFDYYLPQTAHLGEQGVLNMELFFDPNQSTKNENVFGYIPRWAEYKTSYNGIHGDFRGNLNYYHMAREFSSLTPPTLSQQFITTNNVPTRPFAVWQTENPTINHLCWVNLGFKVIASRPMPYHSVPKVL